MNDGKEPSGRDSLNVNEVLQRAGNAPFEILLKSDRSQVMMTSLMPGHTSSRRPAVNRKSDQIIYLIRGEARALVGDENRALSSGSLVLIPAGRPHQVMNTGAGRLMYLNFFAPPVY